MKARTDEDSPPSPKLHYTDPMGARAPALERCFIRHRALEMLLIVFHAEELKRDVMASVAAQQRWRREPPIEGATVSGEGKRQKRAFDYLVKDGVLSEAERRHMIDLIGRRNGIAHHLEQVTADLTIDPWAREWIEYMPERHAYDYGALKQLREARRLLMDRMHAKNYMIEINMRGILFETTERVLTADIKALENRIRRLIRKRRDDIARLNPELSLEGTELVDTLHPRWPENRYGERQRLTPRGVETCYRLFDFGKSPLAVAHLMKISLSAARRRRQLWSHAGGDKRQKRPLAEIPKVPFR